MYNLFLLILFFFLICRVSCAMEQNKHV